MKKMFLFLFITNLMFADTVFKSVDYIYIDNNLYERIKYTTQDDNGKVIDTNYEYKEVSKENKYY